MHIPQTRPSVSQKYSREALQASEAHGQVQATRGNAADVALAARVKLPYPGWDSTDIGGRFQKPQVYGMRAEDSCATVSMGWTDKTTSLHSVDTH